MYIIPQLLLLYNHRSALFHASAELYLSVCFCEQRRGDLVACKVFRSNVSPREDVARQREFKVMMDLKHENIVKFIAVEQEVTLRYVMCAIIHLIRSGGELAITIIVGQKNHKFAGSCAPMANHFRSLFLFSLRK